MSTAVEIAIKTREYQAQLAPVIALLQAGMQPLVRQTTFMAWDSTMPRCDRQFAVLRSMSPCVKRLLTVEKRWRQWDEVEISFDGRALPLKFR